MNGNPNSLPDHPFEGFATEANWTDFGGAGGDMTGKGAVLLVDEIAPLSNGYYILQTAINALTAYETANETECIKPGVVINLPHRKGNIRVQTVVRVPCRL